MAGGANADYPVRFWVDYPEEGLDRLSTALRLIYVIPIAIVLGAIAGGTSFQGASDDTTTFAGATAGVLFFPTLLLIVFRQKYPRWWFDWNLEFLRLSNRVAVYLALLRDEYPSTDEEQAVYLDLDYPDAKNDLNRWYPLFKWLLALPHYIILILLGLAAVFAVIGAWFAILLTGRYPRPLFDFVVGVMRWQNRVSGYAFALVTDRYPPFDLD
ncbi:MAG: DUF4389 domain-containing protein [Thermomicrobiales bacterium]